MSEIIFMVKESEEGGYEAFALGHAIFTEGDSLDHLKDQIRDAVYCHFDDGESRLIRLQYQKL